MIFVIKTDDEVAGLDITNALSLAGIEHLILSKRHDDNAAQQSAHPTVEACLPDRHVYYTAFLSYLFCPYCGERLHSG